MRSMLKLGFLATAAMGSPVMKVIELIADLKTKVQKDLDNEAKAMAEYSSFCDDESTQKGFAIKTASSEIDGYKAVIEDTTGAITELSATLDQAGSETAEKSEELKKATTLRDAENSDFKAAEKELVDTIDALSRAVTIIKREMSFVQSGKKDRTQVQAKLQAMSGALNQIIAAAYIDSSSKDKLKSFLSTNMDDELTLHTQAPQAAVKNYESKSGGIVSTLEDMKDKAESTLQDLRREETKSKHAYELINQSLNDAIAGLNNQVSESNASLAAAQEKKGKAEGDLATTEASMKADEEYKEKLETDCAAKQSEWEERQTSAKSEMEALDKATEILSAKFGGAFIQTTYKAMSMKKGEDSITRDSVVSMLKKMGKKFNSFALMQLANAANKDAFAKIRGLIESMIAKLETQAQEEATQDAFCKEENAKSAKAKETKQSSVEQLQARIDEAKAAVGELKGEVATLTSEIAEINSADNKAAGIRSEEHADYLAAKKDFTEAATAVTQALVVLKDFYKGGAFVQVQQGPEFGAARGDAGHSIIEILTVAEEDFTKLLAETEQSEAEAVEAYKALSQDNEVAKNKKDTSVTAKTSEIKSIEVALTHHTEDYETTSGELAAVMDYIEKLKPQCESKAMSYEERKARRDAEIAGLQEALALLSGGESFVQQKSGFMAVRKVQYPTTTTR